MVVEPVRLGKRQGAKLILRSSQTSKLVGSSWGSPKHAVKRLFASCLGTDYFSENDIKEIVELKRKHDNGEIDLNVEWVSKGEEAAEMLLGIGKRRKLNG